MKANIKKKLLSQFLAMAMVVSISATTGTTALGDTSNRTIMAKSLYEMGLLSGYDKAGTEFGLNDNVTREQALIMMIRTLGEEDAAKAWTGAQPFNDIPKTHWAYSYIGYAKEKGYTVGLNNGAFGLGNTANVQEMTMYILRGLGYSDSPAVGDFDFHSSLTFAKEKGIYSSSDTNASLLRGDMVEIVFRALGADVKNQNYDLLSMLMNKGIVTQQEYDSAMAGMQGGAQSTPVPPQTNNTTPQQTNSNSAAPSTTAPVANAGEVIKAPFKVYNKTGHSIVDLYISDTVSSDYGEDLLSTNNYRSFSNGKYIKFYFEFDQNTTYDFYMRFADGSESEAIGLSFAGADKQGGSINLSKNSVEMILNSNGKQNTNTNNTSLDTQSKQVTERFNKALDRFSAQVDEFNKIDSFTSNDKLVAQMNVISESFDELNKVIGEGIGTLTAEQIAEYTKTLDALESFSNQLDAALQAVK